MGTATARKVESATSFVGGAALFYSVFRSQVCYPLGLPRLVSVGQMGSAGSVPIYFPTVEFYDHRYRTDNPAIIKGLAANANFGRDGGWGWTLELECVPETLRSLWPGLGIDNRRVIAYGLAEGKTADAIFDELDPDDVKKAQAPQPSAGGQQALVCPFKGCGVQIVGLAANVANVQMDNHIRMMHPGQTPGA